MKRYFKQTSILCWCAAVLGGCSSSDMPQQNAVQTQAATVQSANIQVEPTQLKTEFTLNLDNWLKSKPSTSFNTELTIRRDSPKTYLITTHFLQPVQLGIGGFDATGYGRFTMCFINDLARQNNALYWLHVSPQSERGLSFAETRELNGLVILLQKDDPILKQQKVILALQKQFPLYDISESDVQMSNDPLFAGQYCSFYKSNFTH